MDYRQDFLNELLSRYKKLKWLKDSDNYTTHFYSCKVELIAERLGRVLRLSTEDDGVAFSINEINYEIVGEIYDKVKDFVFYENEGWFWKKAKEELLGVSSEDDTDGEFGFR